MFQELNKNLLEHNFPYKNRISYLLLINDVVLYLKSIVISAKYKKAKLISLYIEREKIDVFERRQCHRI